MKTAVQSSTQFARTVSKTGRWRGIKTTVGAQIDEKKKDGPFRRLRNHKPKNQPLLLSYATGNNGPKFNDTGYNSRNEYLVKGPKGSIVYQNQQPETVKKLKKKAGKAGRALKKLNLK